jgi:hypothetical protein
VEGNLCDRKTLWKKKEGWVDWLMDGRKYNDKRGRKWTRNEEEEKGRNEEEGR